MDSLSRLCDYPGDPVRVGKGIMRDRRLESLFAGLDASFDASVAREEDEAASDLAFSLLQGRRLHDVLTRSGAFDFLLGDGSSIAAGTLGADYVAGGRPPIVVPLARAAYEHSKSPQPGPRVEAETLLELLRRWARDGAEVVVASSCGRFSGTIVHAGNDHVAILAGSREILLGLDAVHYFRLVRED